MPIGKLEADLVRRHEGTGPTRRGRLVVYDDDTGKALRPGDTLVGVPTIGYGRNLLRGITPLEADILLEHDLDEAEADCKTFSWWQRPLFNRPRHAALIDVMHNLGLTKFRRFRKMLRALRMGDVDTAADELLDSKYADDVGKRPQQRAWRLARMLRTGQWPRPRSPSARRI